jgi:hypothetical protein
MHGPPYPEHIKTYISVVSGRPVVETMGLQAARALEGCDTLKPGTWDSRAN